MKVIMHVGDIIASIEISKYDNLDKAQQDIVWSRLEHLCRMKLKYDIILGDERR